MVSMLQDFTDKHTCNINTVLLYKAQDKKKKVKWTRRLTPSSTTTTTSSERGEGGGRFTNSASSLKKTQKLFLGRLFVFFSE